MIKVWRLLIWCQLYERWAFGMVDVFSVAPLTNLMQYPSGWCLCPRGWAVRLQGQLRESPASVISGACLLSECLSHHQETLQRIHSDSLKDISPSISFQTSLPFDFNVQTFIGIIYVWLFFSNDCPHSSDTTFLWHTEISIFVFLVRARRSRGGLVESRLRHRCHCRWGPPPPPTTPTGWPLPHWLTPYHHHRHPHWLTPPYHHPLLGITQSHNHVMDGRGARPLRWRSVLVWSFEGAYCFSLECITAFLESCRGLHVQQMIFDWLIQNSGNWWARWFLFIFSLVFEFFILCFAFVVSHSFGFGLMDASAMVDYARNWTTVPEQHRCEIASRTSSRFVSSSFCAWIKASATVEHCSGWFFFVNTRRSVNDSNHSLQSDSGTREDRGVSPQWWLPKFIEKSSDILRTCPSHRYSVFHKKRGTSGETKFVPKDCYKKEGWTKNFLIGFTFEMIQRTGAEGCPAVVTNWFCLCRYF